MFDTTVTSWNELNERLYEGTWNQELGRFRARFAFRGHCDAHQELTTGLMRLGGQYHDLERHILRDFQKYALRDAVSADSIWTWLAVAQHHGLPTRLLDWTYSPYVALHFVTAYADWMGSDGVVWCVDRAAVTSLLPQPLQEIVADEAAGVFTADMLSRAAMTLAEFDALAPEPFVLFFEPPSLDQRIVNQFALFSVMSDPRARLDKWLDDHPEMVRRLIIPAGLKWEVRDKLDQANITERVLFPGLDGLALWLKRYYTPRNGTLR